MLNIEIIEIFEIKNTRETKENICMRDMFESFKENALDYAKQPNAKGENCLYLGMICAMSESESISFMHYIFDDWNAYALDIINGKYYYIVLTEVVYSSWIECKARGYIK